MIVLGSQVFGQALMESCDRLLPISEKLLDPTYSRYPSDNNLIQISEKFRFVLTSTFTLSCQALGGQTHSVKLVKRCAGIRQNGADHMV